eukprot:3131325-Prymnesium_polylepis.1
MANNEHVVAAAHALDHPRCEALAERVVGHEPAVPDRRALLVLDRAAAVRSAELSHLGSLAGATRPVHSQ